MTTDPTYENGVDALSDVAAYVIHTDPLTQRSGMMLDFAPSHTHDHHGSVIVKTEQWDAVLILVPHDAAKLVTVIARRDAQRPPYSELAAPSLSWIRAPRVRGLFWTSFDPRHVSDFDRAARELLTHLKAKEVDS